MAILTKKIKNINTGSGGSSYGSMPDYNRAVELGSYAQNGNKDIPIWKINVPGYLFGTGVYNVNSDLYFALSDTISNLETFTDTEERLVIFGPPPTVGTEFGGTVDPVPIIPGNNTYMTLAGGRMSYQVIFIPCMFVPTSITKANFCDEKSTVTTNWSGLPKLNNLMTPVGTAWKRLFNNNWKANFPNLDLSMYLVHRQSQSSDFREYEVAA